MQYQIKHGFTSFSSLNIVHDSLFKLLVFAFDKCNTISRRITASFTSLNIAQHSLFNLLDFAFDECNTKSKTTLPSFSSIFAQMVTWGQVEIDQNLHCENCDNCSLEQRFI